MREERVRRESEKERARERARESVKIKTEGLAKPLQQYKPLEPLRQVNKGSSTSTSKTRHTVN